MRLRSVTLLGFKSFADKLTVSLREGITGVVGPNGCGKSNLVDAFRWALGEQRAKTLRAEGMDEVIYGGGEGRPPANMAEVTLDFDAPELADRLDGSRELVIRRRLYRNGGSEYYINGRRCRLRDLRQLLAGTGLGAAYYSIIEQGKLDAVLDMDGRKRRLILEEAAGVRGYRLRRDQALSELRQVDAHLQRLREQVDELRSARRRLRAAATRAKTAREIKSEIASLRSSLYGLRLRSARDALARLRPRLSDLRERLAGLRAGVSAAAEAAEKTHLELMRAETQARDARSQMDGLRDDLHRTEIEQTRRREELRATRERLERLERGEGGTVEAEKERLRRDSARLEREVSELDEETRVLEAALKKAEAEVKEARDRLAEAEKSRSSALERAEALLEESVRAANALARCEAERNALAKRLGRLRIETETIRKSLVGVRVDSRALRSEIAGKERALEAARREVEEGGRILESTNRRAAALSRRISELEAQRRAVAAEAGVLRRMLTEDAGASAGRAAAETLNKAGFYAAVLAELRDPSHPALAPAERTLAVDRMEAVETYVRRLGTHESLRFVVLERLSESDGDGLERAARHLTERWPRVDDPLRKRRACGQGVLVDEAVVEILGGRTGYVERKRRLSQLRDRMRRLGGRARALRERRNGLLRRATKIEAALREAERNERALAAEIETLEGRLRGLNERERALESQAEAAAAEQGLALEERERMDEEKERLRREVVSTQEQRRGLLREAASLLEEIRALREELHRREGELGESRVKAAQLAERLRQRGNERRQLKERESELNRLEEARAAEVERLRKVSASLDATIETLARKHGEAEAALQAAGERLRGIDEHMKALRADADSREAELRRLRAALEEAHEEERGLAVEEEGWRQREEAALKGAEEVGVEPRAPEDDEATSESDLLEKLNTNERRLRNLGAVNEEADKELEQVEGRLMFLEEQAEEVSEAHTKLASTVAEMDAICRERLTKTFEAVREQFRSLFRQLFGGGRADLVMEGEDVLEASLEVVARLPGKETAALRLLSGGERAICAIALLFAVYRTHPAPVCLLDELDAPLDDANTARFTALLREYSKESQFIVTTHNKQTMAAVDTLVGVTMATPGRSQIVTVSLANALEMSA